jgi:hypothetical protein
VERKIIAAKSHIAAMVRKGASRVAHLGDRIDRA